MCISAYLQSHQIPFRSFLHQPEPSATRLARSVHVPGRQVAKAVLVGAGGGYVLAVLPATHRVDFQRLSAVIGIAEARLAAEHEVESVFNDCERGALPPFGRPYGLRTFVDASLTGSAEIVLEGNLRHECLRMRFRDYEAIEGPTRARFAEPIAPRRRRTETRRAG